MTNLVGQTLGGYAVLEQLGAGGMGAVFKARQPVLDRIVALKVIAPQVAQDPSFIARFQHEAKSAARLNHSNIVQVYAAGEDSGTHFMVTEFVEGESLQQRLTREGRMDPQEALAICVFVAEGLKYAWDEARIIHRDIKPANIFLSNKGAVKVGDLGLAKSVGPEASAALTQSGTTVGTPFYCSPEQAQAEKEIDFRADIYSLGCMLYHMLSGKKPYESGQDQSPMSVMVRQIHDPPPAILQVLPTCPMPVVLLLNKMLAKHPTGRHGSYDELIADMRHVHDMLGQPQSVAPVSSAPTGAAAKKKSSTMIWAAAAGIAVLLAAGLFVWAPWRMREGESGKRQVEVIQPRNAGVSTAVEQKPERKEEPTAQGTSAPSLPQGQGAKLVEAGQAPGTTTMLPVETAKSGDTMTVDVGGGVAMEFVLIRPGSFTMGSEKGFDNEKPVHQVTITKSFYLGKYEVTQEQWQAVMGNNHSRNKDPKNPAGVVNWDDCQQFVAKLNEKLHGLKASLPTEAQWEYACRAGSDTKFCCGDDESVLAEYSWYKDNSGGSAHPVGQKKPNAWGLYDMHGNVEEWCSDWYGEYPTSAQEDPQGPASGTYRVLRGGGFHNHVTYHTSSRRNNKAFDSRFTNYGLRVVLVAVESAMPAPSAKPADAAEPKVETAASVAKLRLEPVIEGVGWGEVKLGMSEQDLIKLLGSPDGRDKGYDTLSTSQAPPGSFKGSTYQTLSGVTFAISPSRHLWRIDFKEESKAILQSGVRIGSTMDDVSHKYGHPSRTREVRFVGVLTDDDELAVSPTEYGIQRLTKGVTFRFSKANETKLSGFVIYKPQAGTSQPVPAATVANPPPGQPNVSATTLVPTTPTLIAALPVVVAGEITNSIGMRLILINPKSKPDGGRFLMGSPKSEYGREVMRRDFGERDPLPEGDQEKQHWVQLTKPYYLGVTEVTQAQWDRIMGDTPTGIRRGAGPDYPVGVIGYKVVDFAQRLSQLPEEKAAGRVYRIPTEAEWEYACRAGSGSAFHFGNDLTQLVNYDWFADNSDGSAHPVAQKRPNAWGFYDMHGNLREWCLDVYSLYLAEEQTDPAVEQGMPLREGLRVVRGGSYSTPASQSRSAWRFRNGTRTLWREGCGIRVAMTATSMPILSTAVSAPPTEDAFVKEIAALPPERQVARVVARMKELNPGFDGKETHKIENSAVAELAISTAGVTDITPLKALKWLKKLTITPWTANQKGALADLAPLQGLPLTWLWCHNNPITDLTPLRGMPLTVLSCGGTQVRDLAPLAGMKLTVLSVNDTEVSDLSPIQDMPLTVLWCNNTKVTDLTPLKAMPLQELKCDFVADRDAAILRGIKSLARINDLPAATFWMRVPVAAVSDRRNVVGTTTTAGAQRTPLQTTTPALTPAATAKAQTGQPFVTCIGMELLYIPPGEFMMGSTKEEQAWAVQNGCSADYVKREGEAPRKTAVKQGFWMGKTEVTVGQWKLFVAASDYVTDGEKKDANWKDPKFGFKLKDNHPVSCISWNDAMAFCAWLNDREAKAGRLPPGFKVRLPTEAEWEYACRAGKQTKFWWGETKEGGDNRLNWSGKGDGFEFVSPVDHYGARGRNKFGLADMLGNVWEWCLDEFDEKQAHEEPFKGNPGVRVVRGGSFLNRPGDCRCAHRNCSGQSISYCLFGFRVCVGIEH